MLYPITVSATLLAITVQIIHATEFVAKPLTIPEKKSEYKFSLLIDRGLSMASVGDSSIVFLWNTTDHSLYRRGDGSDSAPCDQLVQFDPGDKPVVTADGLHRRFISVNGELPGPPIVVYAGSRVEISVTNNLLAEAVTIHWHGQLQNGTFWYDGAGLVNQCPIRPYETFVYNFTANPPGTYFYHGHFATDRGDGLIGALVVLPTEEPSSLPSVQYAAMLHDWYPTLTANEYSYAKWGINQFYYGWDRLDKCYGETKTYDGSKLGELIWHTALINGRGWHNGSELADNPMQYPLEIFEIKTNETILIRFINGGIMFPYSVSIEGHQMRVVSSDGNNIKPDLVDNFIIFTGERFDVLVTGSSTASCTTCLIKVQSLEMFKENMDPLNEIHTTFAVLRYSDASVQVGPAKPMPGFPPTGCSKTKPCKIVNCPFQMFASKNDTYQCMNFDRIEHLKDQSSNALKDKYEENEFEEYFLNVFVDTNMDGRSFQYPKAPPALFPDDELAVMKPCTCGHDGDCTCTQHLNLTKGNVIQIVLYNRGVKLEDNRALDNFPHPIHIHGHHFYIVAVKYPKYDSTTGLIQSFNDDIDCQGNSLCNAGGWKNKDWKLGQVPGLNLRNPPLKDTIPVPVGGYVVLRFIADNPGWWISHCHMLPHHLDGMAILLREGTKDQLPTRPTDYPQCFRYKDAQVTPSGADRIAKTTAISLVMFTVWKVIS